MKESRKTGTETFFARFPDVIKKKYFGAAFREVR
jgi:hypothetical protein